VCDFGTLSGNIGIVQLFNLLCDGEDRFAPGHDFASQKSRAAENLLGNGPVEQSLERPPVLIELRFQAANPVGLGFVEYQELSDGRLVGAPKLCQTLAILRCVLTSHVEQVVTHEDAGKVDVGPQPAQRRVDLLVMSVELVEFAVDLLRSAR
jgi:hypothetical protein